jgi:formate dehydrogenase iron-sulfur subunit
MPVSRRDLLKFAGVALGGAFLGVEHTQALADTSQSASMLYDATKCVGCNACTNACRAWNKTPIEKDPSGLYDAPKELTAKTWTLIQLYKGQNEYSFVKRQCMHCVHPACVSACPVQALHKTADGPVVYDASKCIGCRYCMVACPFGVPKIDFYEKFPEIKKCTFCADRLVNGQPPACANACPTGAIRFGERDKLVAEAEARIANDPTKYVNHVYGKQEAGGTAILYLSHVPFERLGLPTLGTQPAPALSETVAIYGTPTALATVGVVLATIYWITSRRAERMSKPAARDAPKKKVQS